MTMLSSFKLQGLPVDLAGPRGLCKERFACVAIQKKLKDSCLSSLTTD